MRRMIQELRSVSLGIRYECEAGEHEVGISGYVEVEAIDWMRLKRPAVFV